jgi:hypothetical protein
MARCVASTEVINIWYAGRLGFYKDPFLEPQKSQESDSPVAGDASRKSLMCALT